LQGDRTKISTNGYFILGVITRIIFRYARATIQHGGFNRIFLLYLYMHFKSISNAAMKIIGILISIISIIGCDVGNKTKVEYKVVCSSECDITYEMSGDPYTEFQKSGSWGIVYKAQSGEAVYLSAIKTSVSGNVTATIYLDGKKFKSAQTSVANDRITIEGIIP